MVSGTCSLGGKETKEPSSRRPEAPLLYYESTVRVALPPSLGASGHREASKRELKHLASPTNLTTELSEHEERKRGDDCALGRVFSIGAIEGRPAFEGAEERDQPSRSVESVLWIPRARRNATYLISPNYLRRRGVDGRPTLIDACAGKIAGPQRGPDARDAAQQKPGVWPLTLPRRQPQTPSRTSAPRRAPRFIGLISQNEAWDA
jgi:hypothetical protein